MKNINLLIRQTYFEKYGIRTFAATLVVTLGVTGGIFWQNHSLESQLSDIQQKKLRIDQYVNALMIEKKKDDRTLAYETYLDKVQLMKSSQIEWSPFFRELAERLPSVSRINRAQATEPIADSNQTLVALSVDLKDWFALKEYIQVLKNHPLVVDVKLKGMNREFMFDPASEMANNPLAQSIQSSAVDPIIRNQTIQPPLTNGSMDPFLDQLNQYLAPGSSSNSNDPSVNETDDSSSMDGMEGVSFSAEDLSRAQSILNQMEATENTSIPSSAFSQELEPEQVEKVQSAEFLRCQLDITIRLQSSPKG